MSFIFPAYFFLYYYYYTLSIADLPVLFNFYREREYFRNYSVELSKHFDNRKYRAVVDMIYENYLFRNFEQHY